MVIDKDVRLRYARDVQPLPPPGNPEALDAKGPEYELGPQENLVIGTLATRMKRVGVIQIIASCLQFAGYTSGFLLLEHKHGALQLGTQLPVALAFLVGGFLIYSAASAFRAIVTTQGNDIGLLMKAFDKLAGVMTLLIVAFGVATALWLVGFVLRVTGR